MKEINKETYLKRKYEVLTDRFIPHRKSINSETTIHFPNKD